MSDMSQEHGGHKELLPYGTEYFTGVRSSEPNMTIGNVIGAIKPILELQEIESHLPHEKPLVFIADMHAFTDQNPREIVHNREEILASYLALGIDPNKTDIYVQSQIADEVLMMTMALSRRMSIRQIERVPTLKDKVGEDTKRANMFLAQYPLLMAADIILQRGHIIPTGKDQKAHIEVTRDLVDTINREVGDLILPMPTTMDLEPVNILALKGEGKMSKTDPSRAILLDDSLDEIAFKIRKAQTGISGERSPHLESLITIGKSLSQDPELSKLLDELYLEHLAGKGVSSEIKATITELVTDFVGRYQAKKALIDRNPDILRDSLQVGAERARATAQETLAKLDDNNITLPRYR